MLGKINFKAPVPISQLKTNAILTRVNQFLEVYIISNTCGGEELYLVGIAWQDAAALGHGRVILGS